MKRKQRRGSGVSFPLSHLKQPLLAVRIKPALSVVPSSVCKQEEARALKTRHGGGTRPRSFTLQQLGRG